MYDNHHSDHGPHIGSILIGIAAGVAGTILFATYREREFNRVVGKTREMSDRSAEYLGDVGQNVKNKAVALVDSAEHAVGSLSQSVHKMANKDGMSTTTASGPVT